LCVEWKKSWEIYFQNFIFLFFMVKLKNCIHKIQIRKIEGLHKRDWTPSYSKNFPLKLEASSHLIFWLSKFIFIWLRFEPLWNFSPNRISHFLLWGQAWREGGKSLGNILSRIDCMKSLAKNISDPNIEKETLITWNWDIKKCWEKFFLGTFF